MKKLDPKARDYLVELVERVWDRSPDIVAFAAICALKWRDWLADAHYFAQRPKISVVQLGNDKTGPVR